MRTRKSSSWGQYKPPCGTLLSGDPINIGITARWPFFEGAGYIVTDIGGKNNGTIVAGTPWTPGKFRNAPSLNGSSQWVDCGSSTVLSPAAIGFSGWIKFTNLTPAYSTMISRNAASSTYYQFFVKSTGKLAVYVKAAGGNVSYDGTGAFTLVTGVWYHLSFSYDSVNGLKGYVNGVLDGSAAANGALSSIAANTYLGSDSAGATRVPTGQIDNCGLWKRSLMPSEVMRLYVDPFCGLALPRSLRIKPAASASIIPQAMNSYRQRRMYA